MPPIPCEAMLVELIVAVLVFICTLFMHPTLPIRVIEFLSLIGIIYILVECAFRYINERTSK
jgi:hypothetical protein